MLVLALDTAGPACAVAVARSGAAEPAILARAEERIGRGHAERLMPMIESVLREASASFGDIGRIVVTTGPGSFTGMRIGIAAARGLSLALDIPAVGIGSLDALAYPVVRANAEGTAVAILDARRGEIYALAKNLAAGILTIEAASMRAEELAAKLASAARPLILTGAGAPLVAPLLGAADVLIAGVGESPDIADVVALGLSATWVRVPVPLYARSADAKPQSAAVARR
jgi:tRNA threonylcarbamoyladenosine biosynthesis protein TsaB